MLSCYDLAPSLLGMPREAEPVHPSIWLSRVLGVEVSGMAHAGSSCCVLPGDHPWSWAMKVMEL